MKYDYDIIYGYTPFESNFTNAVKEALNKGWKLAGGVAIHHIQGVPDKTILYQAVYKEIPGKSKSKDLGS